MLQSLNSSQPHIKHIYTPGSVTMTTESCKDSATTLSRVNFSTVCCLVVGLGLDLVSASLVKPKFHLFRHVRRVEPMPFGCVELVEQHGSTRQAQQARLAT